MAHIKGGGIEVIDNFKYSGQRFLDQRKECQTIEELVATDPTSIPNGFIKYVHENDTWYRYHSENEELENLGKWRSAFHSREVSGYEFIYEIVDKEENLLFGIRRDGSTYQPKGIPEEVQARFKELEGWQMTNNDDWMFAISDKLSNVLAGIRYDGEFVVPRGIIKVVSAEEYKNSPQDANILYLIEREDKTIAGAYYKGKAITTGEQYEFLLQDNILVYRGNMSVLPRIGINHDTMSVEVDYPSDYNGPLFENVDGLLMLRQ